MAQKIPLQGWEWGELARHNKKNYSNRTLRSFPKNIYKRLGT